MTLGKKSMNLNHNIIALIILNFATEANDEGTVALMGDYIVQQEKLVWMLTSYLE